MGPGKKQDYKRRFPKNSGKVGIRNVIFKFINTKMKTQFEKMDKFSKKEDLPKGKAFVERVRRKPR